MKRIAVLLLAITCLMTIVSGALRADAATTYTVGNGVVIPNSDVPADGTNKYCNCGISVGSSGHWCCWWYGYYVYYHIWGVYPNRYDDSTHYLRNLPATDRTLTAEHLQMYLDNAAPGALLRIDQDATPSSGDNNGHTLVFVKMNASGGGALFLEGNYDNCGRSRLVEWDFDSMISSYGPGSYYNYQYIKYISWPNAPEFVTVCNHSYTSAETPANCTENGIRQYTCSLCGDSYSESIAALGHSYGEWTIDTAATCAQAGIEKRTCANCGDVVQQEITAVGHSYSAEQMAAACGDYPKTRYSCQVCGDSYDEYGDAIYSQWVTELPEDADTSAVQSKIEYRYRTMLTTTGTDSVMDGWTLLDTTYGEWGNPQTTTSKPTESDTLRITASTQTGWGYYHYCNYYYNGGNNWNVDSIAYGSPNYWHEYCSSVELPAIYFADQGGQQAYGGTETAASPCAYNFYIWFRNPTADVYTYTFETRQLLNWFYKWSDWSDWSETAIDEDEQTNVETRTVYRYITAEKGEHRYSSIETPPTFTQKGAVTYTCELCSDVITEEIPCLTGKVKQWNVALDDDMQINFHFDISQSIETTAKVKITVGEDTLSCKVSALEKTDDGLYVASVNIPAAQMNDPIMVVVMNGSQIGSMDTYTVRQYADTILADESFNEYHAIVKEMLNYGAAAQSYFGYETENLANDGITGTGAENIPVAAETELSVSGKADSISFYAASLLYRDKITVRYYFKAIGDINTYRFIAGGKTYIPALKEGLYYVEVSGITPENLDQQIEMTVTDAQGNNLAVNYGPMNYIVRMNEKGSDSLKALVKALYNYHLAAKKLRNA